MGHAALPLIDPDVHALTAAQAVVLHALEKRTEDLVRMEEAHRREEQIVQHDVRSLQKQWNTMAPISRLPHELLSLVFEAFVADHFNSRLTGQEIHKTSLAGWLIILHICHHWRVVALNNPKLWTELELSCEPYVQFALAHSGNLPLTVCSPWWPLNQEHLWMDPVMEALIPEFGRLRFARLRISGPVEEAFDFARRAGVEAQAPILETLLLEMDSDVTSTRLPLLSEMDLPSLASFTIRHGAYMLVKTFVRPTLTFLNISFSPHCRASTLVPLLGSLPLLQYLTLSGIGGEISEDPLEPTLPNTTVSLRHLQYLSLKADLQSLEIVHLLESLDFPADTEVVFAMDQSGGVDEEIVAQYPAVLPRVTSKVLVSNEPSTVADKAVSPRVIEIPLTHPDYRESLNIVLWSSLRPKDSRARLSVPDLAPVPRLSLTFGTREENAIIHFIDHVDLSEVVVLDVEEDYPVHVWVDAFQDRAMPKLQDLTLKEFAAVSNVLSAMSTPLLASTQAGAASTTEQTHAGSKDLRRYLFPTLETLTLTSYMFRRRPDMAVRNDPFPNVLKALRIRAKHGYKLEKLVIRYPINLTRKVDRAALEDPRIAEFVEIEPGVEDLFTRDDRKVEESDIDSDDEYGGGGDGDGNTD